MVWMGREGNHSWGLELKERGAEFTAKMFFYFEELPCLATINP